jgi:hypothetical protein
MESRFAGARACSRCRLRISAAVHGPCDVLLTKTGGISSTEAAVKGIPMVHTPPIPGGKRRTRSSFPSAACPSMRPARNPPRRTACASRSTRSSARALLAAAKAVPLRAAAEKIAARILGGASPPRTSAHGASPYCLLRLPKALSVICLAFKAPFPISVSHAESAFP